MTPASAGLRSGEAKPWELSRDRLRLPEIVWTQNRPVVVVSAGPGYGKSTLLSQWYRQASDQGHRVIWLTAESDDRHGDQLIMQLANALGRSCDVDGEAVLDSHGSEGRLALVKALLTDLNSHDGRTLLFIDDVHEMLEQSSASTLSLLLRYQPERVILVFSGRAYPRPLTSKPLLEGRLHRFNADRLALTKDETASLLCQHDIRPSKEQVRQLLSRTQGWPAAVRLVALSLQDDEASREHFFKGLVEDTQPLTDYLNDAFLSHQQPRIRDFLSRLSVLRSFTIPQAEAITGMEDASSLLEELDRRALPISRTDGDEPRYSLHPLVRDFLLQHLKRGDGQLLVELRDRARDWLASREMVDAAIEVSLDTDDLDAAAALINQHATKMVQAYGRHTAYLHWINKLPPRELQRFPEIRLRQAWSLDFVKRHEDAERIRGELEQEFLSGDSPSTRAPDGLEQAIELQRCVQAGLQDRAEEATSRSRRWLTRWPNAGLYDRAAAHAVLAFSTKSLSDFEEGLRHARTAQTLARECDAPYLLAWAHMLAVSNLIKQGRYRQALHESADHVAELDTRLGEWSRAVTMLHALRAGLLYEFNRLPEVAYALDRGLTTLVEESSTDPMIVGYVTLARMQNEQGAPLEALETLAEGEVLARTRGLPRLAIALASERVVLLLRHGELGQAQIAWQEIRQSGGGHTPLEAFEKAMEDKSVRIHARTALLQGQYTDACEILAPMLRHAKRTGQKKKQVEVLLIQAQALYHAGDIRKALTLFSDALQIALLEGFVRTLLDEGSGLKPLLNAYLSERENAAPGSPTAEFLTQLTSALGSVSTPPAKPVGGCTNQPLVEPLTARELQILSRLQAGLSNRQLADTLFVTEGTLKWHLRNVYGKLGVTSRLAAVARARELGLIEA